MPQRRNSTVNLRPRYGANTPYNPDHHHRIAETKKKKKKKKANLKALSFGDDEEEESEEPPKKFGKMSKVVPETILLLHFSFD